ncbi:MAG: MFS transporter [Ilumatobacteraceae bacterium]
MMQGDAPPLTEEAAERRRRFSRSFNLLWAATALSNLGDGVRVAALPLLATTVTTDPRAIAGVIFAERIPWLLLILPGGAWADRLDRRDLRVRLDAARAVVMSALVAAVALDEVSLAVIGIVAVLLASAEAVVDSSSMALVPATVAEPDLERAGGRLASTELVANALVGPPLGGLLFGAAMAVPFGVDAASFAGAAVIMTFLPGVFRPAAHAGHDAPMRRQIADGFRWFWSRRPLRNLALISTVLGFADFVGVSVFVLFATQTLGLSGAGYGLLLVPAAFGGIAGSLLAAKLTAHPLGVVLSAAVVISGVSTVATSMSSVPLVVGALGAVTAGGALVWNTLTIALRQRVVPDHLLGRVGASYRFLVYVGMPFGALTGGFLAKSFGLRSAIAVNGCILLAIGLAVPYLLRGIGTDGADKQA